jgi:hypothetical protein
MFGNMEVTQLNREVIDEKNAFIERMKLAVAKMHYNIDQSHNLSEVQYAEWKEQYSAEFDEKWAGLLRKSDPYISLDSDESFRRDAFAHLVITIENSLVSEKLKKAA